MARGFKQDFIDLVAGKVQNSHFQKTSAGNCQGFQPDHRSGFSLLPGLGEINGLKADRLGRGLEAKIGRLLEVFLLSFAINPWHLLSPWPLAYGPSLLCQTETFIS